MSIHREMSERGPKDNSERKREKVNFHMHAYMKERQREKCLSVHV